MILFLLLLLLLLLFTTTTIIIMLYITIPKNKYYYAGLIRVTAFCYCVFIRILRLNTINHFLSHFQ